MLAPRSPNLENAAGVPITGLRRNETEMPHEGHSPNLIELRLITGWINRHLSINISCPLLMDNWKNRTIRPCWRKPLVSGVTGKPYQNRIKPGTIFEDLLLFEKKQKVGRRIRTVSKRHLLRLLSLLIERKADSPTC